MRYREIEAFCLKVPEKRRTAVVCECPLIQSRSCRTLNHQRLTGTYLIDFLYAIEPKDELKRLFDRLANIKRPDRRHVQSIDQSYKLNQETPSQPAIKSYLILTCTFLCSDQKDSESRYNIFSLIFPTSVQYLFTSCPTMYQI